MKTILGIIFLLNLQVLANAQQADSAVYFYQKGVSEKAQNRWLLASKYFDQAIHKNPSYTAAYIENGYANLAMRKTDAALQNFTKLIELDASNPIAIKELTELFYNYHQYQKAIQFAEKCKDYPDAEKIIALSLFQLEEYGKAEKKLLTLVEQRPTDAELLYTLGKTYLEMQLEPQAIKYYEKAIALKTTESTWSFELALLYFAAENYASAIIYFNKATDQGYPKSREWKENVGFSYVYSGAFETGEKMLAEVHDSKPGDTDIYRDLAEFFYGRKQYDKSLGYCQKLMEMNMKDGKALYQAGLCFQKKGQTEKGKAMCDKAIEMDPSLNNLRTKRMNASM